MNYRSRLLIALAIFFSGMALVPQINLYAGVVSWQRFAGGYEDIVTITLVRYLDSAVEGGNLEVRATSTAGGATTLTVWRSSDNQFIGTMTWNGTDHYGLFPITPNPENITVRSNGGGQSSAPVPNVPTAVEISTLAAGSADSPLLPTLAVAALASVALFIALRRRA